MQPLCTVVLAALTFTLVACSSRRDDRDYHLGEPGIPEEPPGTTLSDEYRRTPGAHSERPGKHSSTTGRHGTTGTVGGGTDTQSGSRVVEDRRKRWTTTWTGDDTAGARAPQPASRRRYPADE